MDSEDKKELGDAEHLIAMVGSQGWAIFRQRYLKIVNNLSDLRNIPTTIKEGDKDRELTEAERMKEMSKREGALSLFQELFDGITTDIENFHETMSEDMEEKEGDNILRLPDETKD